MFSGMFSYVFRNFFLCFLSFYDASFSFVTTGCSDFFYFQKKEESIGIWFFKTEMSRRSLKSGFQNFSFLILSK
jgi:hypothetical protein